MKPSYKIGEMVYLKTDVDQHERMVTGYSVRATGITYELSFGTSSSWHYEFEITGECDTLKKVE